MTAPILGGNKIFKATPPDKGSFPLDHEGECRLFYMKFLMCLKENNYENTKCRDESKAYLECRMDKGLMAKESWDSLGYDEDDANKSKNEDKTNAASSTKGS